MHNVTYRTDILQKNNIHLDNCFYTDAEYLLYPIPYVKTVTVAPQTIYMYRVSLSTQSMNINSLQRNCAMHELVLGHLSDAYAAYENSGTSEPKIAAFLRRNIARIAGMQLFIYLTATDSKAAKQSAKAMVKTIKGKSETLYTELNGAKSFKMLTSTNFLLFPVLASMKKREVGAND